jgi:hypothetical protein
MSPMRPMRFVRLFALLVVFVCSAMSQFEGVMEMKTTSSHGEGAMRTAQFSLFIKGNRLVADVKEAAGVRQPGKMIFRGDKMVMWVVDDARKSYMEIDMKDAEPEGESANDEKASGSKIHKTGKSMPILGYVCDEWVVNDGDEQISIWGTSNLGMMYEDLYKAFGQMKRRGPGHAAGGGWEGDLARTKVFPLKIVRSRDGAVTETQEMTRIEAKSLPASQFEVPAGYAKQDMGGGMQEMMNKLQKKGIPNGGEVNKEELEKMLKDLQKSLKKPGGGGEADTSHDDDHR